MKPISLPPTLARATGIVALCALAACGPVDESAVADADGGPGLLLFEENCASCHGDGGLGDGPMAASLPVQPPSLMEHLGHHPMDQLVRIIQTGVPPAMPPAPLTEDEILTVIDHAWTLVPDSMVAELREMQRMAETGMEMNMDMDMPSGGAGMDHGAMGHAAAADTTPR